MKKGSALALSALALFSALAPLAATDAEARRYRNRGLAVGAGVVLGVAAAAAIANSNRAYAGDGYYYDRGRSFGYTCRKWWRQCQNGSDWACEKYDSRGC